MSQAATHTVDIGTDGQGSRGSAQGIDDIVMSGDFELGRGDERGLDAFRRMTILPSRTNAASSPAGSSKATLQMRRPGV